MYRLRVLILWFFILSSVLYIVLSDETSTVMMSLNVNDDENDNNRIHDSDYSDAHQNKQDQSIHQFIDESDGKVIVQDANVHDKVKVIINIINSITTSPIFTTLNKQLQFIIKIIKSILQQSILLTRQISNRIIKMIINNIYDDKIHSTLWLTRTRLIHLIHHIVDRILNNCDTNKLILLLTVCYSVVQLVT